jgi:predicted AlkP superfamily phosphohydrolase/phosphomutase
VDRSLAGRLRSLKAKLAGMLPWQLKRLLSPITEEARAIGAEQENLSPIVWDRTDALVLTQNPVAEVWLNLAERSPRGRVPPERREALEEELRDFLLGVTAADSGRPVVEQVLRREDCVHGPWSHHVADLLVAFDQSEPCEEVLARGRDGTTIHVDSTSPGTSEVQFCGHHEPWGFIAAHGPDIARGIEDVECHVRDLMPTLAYLLTGEVPEGLDGKLIESLIAPESLQARPPVEGPPVPPPEGDDEYTYTEAERADVEQRLRDLGYL